MPPHGFDLAASAREEMIHEGFQPDFPPGTGDQLAAARQRPPIGPTGDERDLRNLLWSSIDNDSSRDLDQIEVAERVNGGIRISIGIADVDGDVPAGSPIDTHAASQTTTVYTAVRTFPMLPEALSTDLTSLSQDVDRPAIVIDIVVASDGSIASSAIYRAVVRNTAQLTYEGIGPWLEGSAAPPDKVASSADLQAQLKLQDEAAGALRQRRHEAGALDFDRVEAQPLLTNGEVKDIAARRNNRASALIEDFMVAANEAMAKSLNAARVAAIRRVVKAPERWPRIVELAEQHGAKLPAQPDSAALAGFLREQKRKDETHYPDLSLAVIKLMGPGEYVLARPGDPSPGHFGLAAQDYTHSTAPNRRFADLVTQRLIKAVLDHKPAPYSDDELSAIAKNCTLKEDAARKVERNMGKRAAAVAFHNRIGQSFHAVVTGVTPKGTFVRVLDPPVEGRLMRGEQGVDVGDKIEVTLLSTDAQRGYIDFAR
jgi:VacB/RNase II family 3'-5' exoribonuclease